MKLFLMTVTILCMLPWHLAAWKDVDYSQKNNWVILENAQKCDVDVFYVLPTIFSSKKSKNMHWHDSPALQKKAQTIALWDTGIFAEYGRIFAPYYRQASFSVAVREAARPIAERHFSNLGTADVKNQLDTLRARNQSPDYVLFSIYSGRDSDWSKSKVKCSTGEEEKYNIITNFVTHPEYETIFKDDYFLIYRKKK